jgi:subtilase family serine protease
MRRRYAPAIPATTAAVIAGLAINASGATAAGRSGAVTLKGSQAAAANSTPRVGSVASGSRIDFEVQLKPSAGAQAFAKAVSTPGGESYRKFLTPAQWESRFSPTARQVAEVTTFLRSTGFKVDQVSADRMAVKASGTAAQVERAFSTSLSYHRVNRAKLRLNDRGMSVPAALAGIVVGVTGIEQTPARPFSTTDDPARSAPAASGAISAPPPPGFRVAPPAAATTTRRSTPRCPRTAMATRRILRGRPAATRRRSSAARTT